MRRTISLEAIKLKYGQPTANLIYELRHNVDVTVDPELVENNFFQFVYFHSANFYSLIFIYIYIV